MDAYKEHFIEFLLSTGALRVGGDFTLKSKRLSPYFVNIGDFSDGASTAALGGYYADAILTSGADCDLIYGIPEKGTALAVATAISLSAKGKNVPWFFTRKQPKDYGEASQLSPQERIKALVVGKAPADGAAIVQLDDVFTAGDAKHQARETLLGMGTFKLPLLAIAVDRQEVGLDGKSAIEEYEKTTGTTVISIVSASEIYDYLLPRCERESVHAPSSDISLEHVMRMANYLRAYGTQAARATLPPLMQRIIGEERSVIPACDVSSLEEFERLIQQTSEIEKIGAYKIGFELGLGFGLERVVETARKYTQKPLIYDHQKASTDIPETGKNFARVCKQAGLDAVILFPQAGPETERAWVYHALDADLGVIVGGSMTHPAYAQSEGGFVADEGALAMYRIAAQAGVNHFVVPGNKPAVIQEIKSIVEAEGVDPVFFAPGFVAQGGKIEDATKVAGTRWHAIVGRGITAAPDPHQAALEYSSQL